MSRGRMSTKGYFRRGGDPLSQTQLDFLESKKIDPSSDLNLSLAILEDEADKSTLREIIATQNSKTSVAPQMINTSGATQMINPSGSATVTFEQAQADVNALLHDTIQHTDETDEAAITGLLSLNKYSSLTEEERAELIKMRVGGRRKSKRRKTRRRKTRR